MASFRRSVRQGSVKNQRVPRNGSRGRVSGSGVLVRNYGDRTRREPRVRRDDLREFDGQVQGQIEGCRFPGGSRSPGCVGDKRRRQQQGNQAEALDQLGRPASVHEQRGGDTEHRHQEGSGISERQVLAGEGCRGSGSLKVGRLLGPYAAIKIPPKFDWRRESPKAGGDRKKKPRSGDEGAHV